nr:hypothetical protein [Clostridioides sp.]
MLNESFRYKQISILEELKNKINELNNILNKEDLDFKDIIEFVTIEGKIVAELQNMSNDILSVSI